MKYIAFIFCFLVLYNCKHERSNANRDLDVNKLINKAIDYSGGDRYGDSDIKFNFRDKLYRALRHNGSFQLERLFVNEQGDQIRDVITNKGFNRYINNERIVLEDSIAGLYAASVNSVHYFSILPYGLNDPAVNKELLGTETIRNKVYYKIEVTFNKIGGGEDYEDVFVYWVDKEVFNVDYLAYSYNEDDGQGLRFRASYNERFVNGLRFVDYNNFKPTTNEAKLSQLAQEFESGNLELLSKIELENITVDLIE